MSAPPVPDLILAAALDFASNGQSVFPCYPADVGQSRAKEPLTHHGFLDASLDPDRITRWWTRFPAAAIGLPTGLRWNVLDVDKKVGGVNGYAALGFLASLGLLDGAAQYVTTPSGGCHVYFPVDLDDRMPNAVFAQAGIDLRGFGGYVIGAPSMMFHSTGHYKGAYEVLEDRGTSGAAPLDWREVRRMLGHEPPPRRSVRQVIADETTPRPVARVRGGRGSTRRLAQRAAEVAATPQGGRNDALFRAACWALRGGLDTEPIAEAAAEAGLPAYEIESTMDSARRAVGA